VIAVDPTSPFSDGAILGDRIRMQRHNLDDGVFIKSMATRGHFGGLTQSTRSVINILDAMGSGYIIVETVGVGQDEVDIVKTAHTTVVVTMPGMGDGLQAIKAGGLEIGDIFVINKVHLGGADNTAADISLMLNLDQRRRKENNWTPPVLKIEATSSEEINSLVREIENHKSFLQSLPNPTKAQIAKSKIKNELLEITQARVIQETLKEINESEEFITLVDDIFEKRTDPYSASEKIMPQRFLSLSFAKINRGLGLGEKA
jgi:LAO/AO transport system kinase